MATKRAAPPPEGDLCPSSTQKLTEEEAALYDRQIRLWGLDSQKRLRATRVLLIGAGGLGAEVAKNLVLAGVDQLTLVDNETVKKDGGDQFLLWRASPGENRASGSVPHLRTLNPRVRVDVAEWAAVEEGGAALRGLVAAYDVVVVAGQSTEVMLRVNDACRSVGECGGGGKGDGSGVSGKGTDGDNGDGIGDETGGADEDGKSASGEVAAAATPMFLGGSVFGFAGYFFADLGPEHRYMTEEAASDVLEDDLEADPAPGVQTTEGTPSAAGVSQMPPAPKKRKVYDGERAPSEKVAVARSMRCLSLAASLASRPRDWTPVLTRKSLRRQPWLADFLLLVDVMQGFRDRQGRAATPADLAALAAWKAEVAQRLPDGGHPRGILPPDESMSIFCCGEAAPASAIVGGLLSQEVIRAVTRSEPTVRAFSFFNALGGTLRTGQFAPL